MTTDPSFSVHPFDEFLWVRLYTRGSFMNSSNLRTAVEKYIADGGNSVVIDLEICQAVDSTFMGTLVGLANLCEEAEGSLQLANPTERTRSAMESLGLDLIIDIDPEDAIWLARVADIRATVESLHPQELDLSVPPISDEERTHHVLDAHKALCELNEKNEETFGYVCESLEEELRQRNNS